eukprot:TRINITY_DN3024_c0_g2_i1.p1 TRINITY_DN3024_c0_g2~~TRINITY_DN3024_c0_g2_i1.p1  ORF type:complete len:1409 (+),score=379.61 TRINITY_DN3024_c0_g2_i1:529-4227(+)
MAAAFDFSSCMPCPAPLYDVFLRWECDKIPGKNNTLSKVQMCRDVMCDFRTDCYCHPGTNWDLYMYCDYPADLKIRIGHRTDSPCTRIQITGNIIAECADGYIRRSLRGTICTKCTVDKDCNGHAVSVTTDPGVDTWCRCHCMQGYQGRDCNLCSAGYIQVGNNCEECTIATSCSQRADYVEAVNNKCHCFCHTGYAPSTTDHVGSMACVTCADGYVGKNCNTQCSASYCNNRGTPVAVPPLSSGITRFNQTCSCECWNWYSGDTCTDCRPEFSGTQCDTCAPGHILEPVACVMATCDNCSYPLHSTCTGCRACLQQDCSYHAKRGGITTDADSRSCVCLCTDQWEGEDCDKCPAKYEQSTCRSCGPNRDTYPVCECVANFYGDDCSLCSAKYNQTTCDRCAENRNQFLYPACPCINQYEGVNCTVCSHKYNPDGCNECSANRDNSTFPECKCMNMYHGTYCDECDVKYDNATCSVCAANRNQSLFPACPCSGMYEGQTCMSCDTKYNQTGCNACNVNREGYPLCTCTGMYTEQSNCTTCDLNKFNDTCNGCRNVPQRLYDTGCFPCADTMQVMDVTGTCLPCPEGLICDGSMFTNVLEGWWRQTEFYCGGTCGKLSKELCDTDYCKWDTDHSACVDKNTEDPFCGMFITPSRCHTPHCTGSNSSMRSTETLLLRAAAPVSCVNGTDSVLCGVCGEGSVLSNGKCHKCGSQTTESLIAASSVIGAVVCALAFVYISFPKTIKKKPLFLRAIKQMVSHLQVLAIFASLRLPWGSILDGLTGSAARVSSVGSDPAALLCVTHNLDLSDTTLFWLFAVPILLLGLAVASAMIFGRSVPKGEEKAVPPKKQVIELCKLCWSAWGETQCKDCMGVRCRACGKVCRAQGHCETPIVFAEGGARVLPQKKNVFVNAGVVLYFLTWSNIVKELLRPLSCTEYYTKWGATHSVVTSDARLQCGGVTMGLAALGIIFHTVFIPVSLALLFKARCESLHEFQWVSSLGFMYTEYRRRYCWWESTVLLRKGLVMLIANTNHTPAVKVYSMVVVFLFFLTLNVMCRPYREPVQQHLESLSLVTLLGTILTGEWIVHNENTHTQDVLVRISVVQNAVFLLVWLGVMVYAVKQHTALDVETEQMEEMKDVAYCPPEMCEDGYIDDIGSDGKASCDEDHGDGEQPDGEPKEKRSSGYISDSGSSGVGCEPVNVPSVSQSATESLLSGVSPSPSTVGTYRSEAFKRVGV